MNVLLTILLTILVVANMALFMTVLFFKRGKSVKASKASRIGFAFMEMVFFCNIIAIIGGMVVCLA